MMTSMSSEGGGRCSRIMSAVTKPVLYGQPEENEKKSQSDIGGNIAHIFIVPLIPFRLRFTLSISPRQ